MTSNKQTPAVSGPAATPEAQIPEGRIDYAARDRARGEALLSAFISWVNADDEDATVVHRSDGCYMRDEIERLRKAESQLAALRVERDQMQVELATDEAYVSGLLAERSQLRVERDQAWNEALEAARTALNVAGRPVNCISVIRSLARPIPAEKPDTRKGDPIV